MTLLPLNAQPVAHFTEIICTIAARSIFRQIASLNGQLNALVVPGADNAAPI